MEHSAFQTAAGRSAIVRKGAPNVFEYEDFRAFLRDYYQHQKLTNDKFSFRFFTAKLGYSSPSFFKLIMEGKRNLTSDGIARFSKAMGLSESAAAFFRNLVLFNQAETVDDKQRYAGEIARSKSIKEKQPIAQTKFKYWDTWYNVAIRELIGVEGFQENPAWIASAVIPAITPEQARESLEQLLALGLIERDRDGRLTLVETDVRTGDQVSTAAIKDFHREMAARGKESIDRFKADRRQVSSLTLSLSEEGEKRIREMLNAFQREIIAVAEADAKRARVVQVNFQLFPLTRGIVKEEMPR